MHGRGKVPCGEYEEKVSAVYAKMWSPLSFVDTPYASPWTYGSKISGVASRKPIEIHVGKKNIFMLLEDENVVTN